MYEEFVSSLDLLESVISEKRSFCSFIKSSGQKLQIWGVGNTLLGDDAVGPMVSIRLGGIDCGTVPENYISILRKDKPKVLIIIDAAEMGLMAGSVRMLSFDEFSDVLLTSHAMPLSVLLEQFRKTIDIFLIGIQPKQINPGEPLSTEVNAAADFIVEKLGKLVSR